jgi:hypothetical protein
MPSYYLPDVPFGFLPIKEAWIVSHSSPHHCVNTLTPYLIKTHGLLTFWQYLANKKLSKKVDIVLDRLQDRTASYNQLTQNGKLYAQAYAIMLAVEIATLVDTVNIHEHFKHNPPRRLAAEPLN